MQCQLHPLQAMSAASARVAGRARPTGFPEGFRCRIPVQSTGRGRLGACEPGGPSCRSRSRAPIPVDWVVEILNERDREILPSRFMKSPCEMDQDAIRNNTSNEFRTEELWTELGGYNIERVYPIVEDYFLNLYHYIVKHPNGRISLTNAGRKSCDQQFVLPHVLKPSALRLLPDINSLFKILDL